MEEKKDYRKELFYKKKNGYDNMDAAARSAMEDYCEGYKAYLNDSRTEREAVTNAIIHGYDGTTGMVRMEGRISGNTVEFTVSDYGCGIEDIAQAREPLYTGKPELERSGMGFAIMESFMDSIEVESRIGLGTTVRMTKVIGV